MNSDCVLCGEFTDWLVPVVIEDVSGDVPVCLGCKGKETFEDDLRQAMLDGKVRALNIRHAPVDREEAAAESVQAIERLERVIVTLRRSVVTAGELARVPDLVDEANQCLSVVLGNAEAITAEESRRRQA